MRALWDSMFPLIMLPDKHCFQKLILGSRPGTCLWRFLQCRVWIWAFWSLIPCVSILLSFESPTEIFLLAGSCLYFFSLEDLNSTAFCTCWCILAKLCDWDFDQAKCDWSSEIWNPSWTNCAVFGTTCCPTSCKWHSNRSSCKFNYWSQTSYNHQRKSYNLIQSNMWTCLVLLEAMDSEFATNLELCVYQHLGVYWNAMVTQNSYFSDQWAWHLFSTGCLGPDQAVASRNSEGPTFQSSSVWQFWVRRIVFRDCSRI